MNIHLKRYKQTETVDMERLLTTILHNMWMVVVITILCATMTFAGTHFFVTPMYQSAAMFYVNNRNVAVGDMQVAFSSEDIRVSRGLVDTYVVILNTRRTLEDIIDYAGIARDVDELQSSLEVEVAEMISTEAVNGTEIFRVVVTGSDPIETEQIASAVASVLPLRIAEIIEGTSAKIVDSAIIPSKPSSPDTKNNVILGALFGFVLGIGIIAIRDMYDLTIRSENVLNQFNNIPVLSVIPDVHKNINWDYEAEDCSRLSPK